MKKIKIGIDLDNTITASKTSELFFSFFTNICSERIKIFIITNRDTHEQSKAETIFELKKLGIAYHKLVITANKSKFIKNNNINVFFEDTDEYFQDLPEDVLVFKTREAGNYDFGKLGKWIYSDKTGINIDIKN